ncbi:MULTISPECIES: M23 family metallopeptidase [Bradyrhizobium]|uniref:M23 family metallopeptidase n=4 Tax=Bradyrhizobium TaxID=374 RepID=A0ABS5GDE4_9BRAD|nr:MULTISPECIES: M23 family metallopeptidase [Bradyrhizobium]RTM04069.1 MAG: M23 family metallopeptidase [Bradyrhizobiaceae bacterium]ABQ33440.1 putative metalloendopeptidase [Bradyrhizobium sp. BTAi1]MBR1139363.1 M23 family metallopeptidase [Bradyrhizobium denitrificans]MCL8489469.1 M23 family metallopeptidase [Bradyrhizobium denitrificans]MDU1496204.1 M23 family metallopeptidase [Bradyrhizobium sp.]
MNHRTSRGGYGREVGMIDLGHEPPLSVDGSEAAVIDRRRVSVQWFSGTILTGLCGAALIGGAVFASLDGEMTFARMPERVESALRGAFGANDRVATLRKSDRLPPPSEAAAARNVVRVSTVTRAGSRELIRVRPYVRISGNLSMTTSDLSAKIPPFNAQRLLNDGDNDKTGSGEDPNNPEAVEPDAEVSFVTKDLAGVLPKAKIAASVALDEIVMRVRDAANWRGNNGGVRYASLANAAADATGVQGVQGGDLKLSYASDGTSPDPYAGFETRVVPENVTLLPKTKDQITGGNPLGERVHLVKKGDTVTSILRDQGATPDEAKAIAAQLGTRGRDGGLKEGEKLRILMAPSSPAPGARLQPFRVIVANESMIEAVAALSDLGKYVAVDVQSMNTVTETADNTNDEEDDGTGVRLYQSIYETAMRNKVPAPVIEDMIRIYSYDVDFQRKVQPGDSFDVFYAGDDDDKPGTNDKSEVLFASLTVGGETKKYYRFQTPDDSVVDYYDETGKSAKKFLVRKPVNNAIMRSGFGGRRHPILGYVKMHTGVDWATAYGTPIFASGNGVLEKVGTEGGYGKYIRIKHNNGYETAYGHLSAFAKGMEPGKRVRQGQVIGFVGSTGMSTGPHVHYEILVNGRFVDPMRVKLPRGRSLEGQMMASFEKERDRVDQMMTSRGNGASRISDAGPIQVSR